MAWEEAIGLWAPILPGAPPWGLLLTLGIPRSTYLTKHGVGSGTDNMAIVLTPKSGGVFAVMSMGPTILSVSLALASHSWSTSLYLVTPSDGRQQPIGCSHGQGRTLRAEVRRDCMGWIT